MTTRSSRLLSALAATLLLAGGAWAQSQGGDNPVPSGDRSLDCDRGTVNASGTESARASSTKHARSAPMHKAHVNRDAGTLHASFPQCAAKDDRSARAECVRTAWEARHGTPGAGTTLASNSSRRPC